MIDDNALVGVVAAAAPLPGVGAGRGPISSGTQSTHSPDKCYPSLFRFLRSIRYREADGGGSRPVHSEWTAAKDAPGDRQPRLSHNTDNLSPGHG